MSSLHLDGVSKRFGSEIGVDNLSVAVDGDCLALLGPSGCGKTTTINMIAGFVEPDSGSIHIDDKDVRGVPPHKRNTGMVFQDYALFPHKTVAENIAFGLRMRSVPRSDRAARVAEVLALVGLSNLANRYPHQISGGQRQRVALARALVIRPSILLLDEPLSNLDARLREFLREEIRRVLEATKITAIFVTHDQAEAFAAADRVALMDRGKIVQLGTAKDLYQNPVSHFVAQFFGDCNFLDVKEIAPGEEGSVVALTEQGWLRIAKPLSSGIAASAGNLSLAIRPEQLFLLQSDHPNVPTNSLPGKISSIRYFGSLTKLEIALANGAVLKLDQQQPPDGLSTGQDVEVAWLAQHGALVRSESAR